MTAPRAEPRATRAQLRRAAAPGDDRTRTYRPSVEHPMRPSRDRVGHWPSPPSGAGSALSVGVVDPFDDGVVVGRPRSDGWVGESARSAACRQRDLFGEELAEERVEDVEGGVVEVRR